MLRLSFCFCVGLVLTGCQTASTSAPTPNRPPPAETQTTSQATVQREWVKVDGQTYIVQVSPDRQTAIVDISRVKGDFVGRDIEAAAQLATGCSAAIIPGDWAFLGDLKSFNLSNLRPNVRGSFTGWEVVLGC